MANAVGDEEKTIDRISSLPDDILYHILTFLPSNYSIRTIFLSTRFQYLWWSIPVLDCRDNLYLSKFFEKFMEKALSNHEDLPRVLRKFCLRCYDTRYSKITVSKWIDSATASVFYLEELDIFVRPIHHVNLPSIFFSCRRLKTLKLGGRIIVDNVPTGVLFPCLKTIKFLSISIVLDNPLNNLLSAVCPVLENFHIEDCSLKILRKKKTELELKYLRGSWIQGDCPNNLSSLDSSSITVTKSNRDPSFKVLKQLELCDTDMFQILKFIGKHGNRPVFQHLTHLVVKVDNKNRFSALPVLLEHSPNLTSLVLEKAKVLAENWKVLPYIFGYRQYINEWDAPATTVSKCLSCNLETIQIKEFIGFQEVKVVKYFLKNALVLKNLVLCVARSVSNEIKASILDEPRASDQCEIEFRFNYNLI